MKKLLLIAAIICHILPANAQWQWINPIPPLIESNSMTHVSGQTYVLVGCHYIVKTEDGGNSWVHTKHPQVRSFNKVFFLDENIGFVVGSNAIFLKTTDGGDSWIKKDTGSETAYYEEVYFINEDVGFISDMMGRLYKTTDGGENWTQITIPGVNQGLRAIRFIDENTGYIAGSAGVFAKTTNGGEDWDVLHSQLSFYWLHDMHLIDEETIILASWGGIYKSTDSGVTWVAKLNPDDEVMALSFVSDTKGYALGKMSRIYKTTDAGETWTNTNLLPDYYLDFNFNKFLALENEHKGLVAGSFNETALIDLQSNTYETGSQFLLTDEQFNDADFVNDTTIVAVGHLVIARSNTNGRTWTIMEPLHPNDNYQKVHFIDENTGFIVGLNYSDLEFGGIILKTTDGGKNWVLNNNLPGGFRSVHFVDAHTGYVVGVHGFIYKTTNGGEDWVAQNSQVDVLLNSVFFTDANTGYVCGDSGTIISTTDGGQTWTEAEKVTNHDIFSIHFINDTTGFTAVRSNGYAKTTNAGEDWEWITLSVAPYSNRVRDIAFYSEQDGYMVGNNGFIFSTNDGGETWEFTLLSEYSDLYGLAVRDENTVIAVGQWGAILRNYTGPEEYPIDEGDDSDDTTSIFTCGGIDFSVFPNPFDNQIKIRGDFSNQQQILIEIFDIQGRLIYQTEKNSYGMEYLSVDTNVIQGGIYILRLRTNTYTTSFKIIKNQ
ncbi:MAG: T9SS C-terminal target domain-containing protein [Bacteroidetes bacterium]|nr:MAG: T9SS C-terminal target domain-containing protein [Bacteroidota bacterium]